ncbi:hypothetical protein I4U23_002064 [Adineta vaga]|nr:hypothetical protein I4U23_002064 [Adineta vaga]
MRVVIKISLMFQNTQNEHLLFDEKEFRLFLGFENQEKDKARDLTQYDAQAFASSPVVQILTYEIVLDVAVDDFFKDPYSYEAYTTDITNDKDHKYELGSDVRISALDVPKKLFNMMQLEQCFIMQT